MRAAGHGHLEGSGSPGAQKDGQVSSTGSAVTSALGMAVGRRKAAVWGCWAQPPMGEEVAGPSAERRGAAALRVPTAAPGDAAHGRAQRRCCPSLPNSSGTTARLTSALVGCPALTPTGCFQAQKPSWVQQLLLSTSSEAALLRWAVAVESRMGDSRMVGTAAALPCAYCRLWEAGASGRQRGRVGGWRTRLGAEGRNSWCQHVKYPVKYPSAPPRASWCGWRCLAPWMASSAQSKPGEAGQSGPSTSPRQEQPGAPAVSWELRGMRAQQGPGSSTSSSNQRRVKHRSSSPCRAGPLSPCDATASTRPRTRWKRGESSSPSSDHTRARPGLGWNRGISTARGPWGGCNMAVRRHRSHWPPPCPVGLVAPASRPPLHSLFVARASPASWRGQQPQVWHGDTAPELKGTRWAGVAACRVHQGWCCTCHVLPSSRAEGGRHPHPHASCIHSMGAKGGERRKVSDGITAWGCGSFLSSSAQRVCVK